MVLVVLMITQTTYGQHYSSARGIGLGGYTTLSTGVSSLDWNPATLGDINDWEVSIANYIPFSIGASGVVLHSISLTKKFLQHQAVSLRYAPGKRAEFLIPTTVQFGDSNVAIQTTFDQTVVYEEPYALGYAYRPSDNLSLGVTGRFINERVSDTQYVLDTNSTIRSQVVAYNGNLLSVDAGALWEMKEWGFGVVVKNALVVSENRLPEDVVQYRMQVTRFLRLGVRYSALQPLLFGFDGDTERRFRLGAEWTLQRIPQFLHTLSFRAGTYADLHNKSVVEAVGIGFGGTFEPVEFDVAYLKFLSQTNRRGTADLSSFSGASVPDVEVNRFAGDRLTTTLRFHLGRSRERVVRIEGVKTLTDVYPSLSLRYAVQPVAEVVVRNASDNTVEATVSLLIERLMDAPTESMPVRIGAGERVSVPVYALFNDAVRSVQRAAVREGYVYVTTQRGKEHDDRYQVQLLIHGRNDWNGDVAQLPCFITPDDPEVLRFTRDVLHQQKEHIDSADVRRRNLLRAKVLFDAFARRLSYVNDPKKSQDFVQYPSETLALRGGDCDDMTVCFASLLMSVGIPVALIDIVPPANPNAAHIYMMFDTGVEGGDAQMVSDNPKRFVVRRNNKGKHTVWIPVETTVITQGFDEAWSVGAREYYDDVEVGLGLVKGWVKIVDVQSVY